MPIFVKASRRARSYVRSYSRKRQLDQRISKALSNVTKAMNRVSPAAKIHKISPTAKKRLTSLGRRFNKVSAMRSNIWFGDK